MSRFATRLVGGFAVAGLLMSPVGLMAEDEEMEPSETYSGTFYLMQTIFNDQHSLGSEVETEEVEEAVKLDGVNSLAALFEEEGKTTLLHRFEVSGIVGDNMNIFVGDEIPIRTEMKDKDGTTTWSQRSINSGLTAETRLVDLDSEGLFEMEYDINFDSAFPAENDPSMISRLRLRWTGSALLNEEDSTVTGRFTRELNGRPVEYLLILNLSLPE